MSVEADDQEFDAAFAEQGKPVAEAPQETPPEAAPPAEPAAPVEAEQTDPIEDLRRQLAEARHRLQSDDGRVQRYQRDRDQYASQVAQLQREVDEWKAKASHEAPPAAEEDEADVLKEAPDLESAVQRRIKAALDARLKPTEARLDEVGQTAQRAARQVEPLVSREEQQAAQQVFAELDRHFGDWKATVKSSEFSEWLAEQPQAVQTLYSDGRTFKEAASVLKLFRADKGQPDKDKGATNHNRLQAAAGIAPRSVVRPQTKADDFEGSFAEFAAKR